jgi:ribose-phosphate pyrophosphokinase
MVERCPDGTVAVKKRGPSHAIDPPTSSDNLLELLDLADACRRAGAGRITAIVPYFGHGRADKRNGRREPIMARVIADVLQVVGVDQVVVVDLHTPQIEGFFYAPVDSLTAVPILCQALAGRLPADIVVVSPDVGRVGMASRYAQSLGTSVVVLHKQRLSGIKTRITHVVGNVSTSRA